VSSPAISLAAASPSVSIIIPTKNQLPLLKACLNGLRFETGYPIIEILIVDNGSDASVQAYYATLRDDPRIRIMPMPGRFNFSTMCNAAAAQAKGECLVFLNNDMSVVSPDWLGVLAALVMRPDVGAAGARLLFPDGALQHAGVVVGMGGYADHVSHGAPGDHVGYLGRLGVVHEVSAVTGACIAIEARKFHAVEGFDAERFPVELNDIDLCLRLARAGWRTIMSPQSVLIHHQSATRGFSFRPFERYGLERGHFRNLWADVIRDDPFFHPALSLFSPEPALDG
jgi:GT2 family glycosyltransferase